MAAGEITVVVVPVGCARASLNAAAVLNRSAGSFSSARSTAASTWGGTVCRCGRSGLGASVSTRATIPWAVLPVNGGSPVSISYSTHPSAYTSLRASLGAPVTCSGEM